MFIPFINQGMNYSCAQFDDNEPMSYVEEENQVVIKYGEKEN
jgi:hypothetical protein